MVLTAKTTALPKRRPAYPAATTAGGLGVAPLYTYTELVRVASKARYIALPHQLKMARRFGPLTPEITLVSNALPLCMYGLFVFSALRLYHYTTSRLRRQAEIIENTPPSRIAARSNQHRHLCTSGQALG